VFDDTKTLANLKLAFTLGEKVTRFANWSLKS